MVKFNEEMLVLILVKAYPEPSKTYGESVCIAGLRIDAPSPTWVRLYPLNFRALPDEQRFKKYDVIRLQARRRSDKDPRPESYSPILETIEVVDHIGTTDGWRQRSRFVEPLLIPSMCELQRRQKENRTSLGAFRPSEIVSLKTKPATPWHPGKRALGDRQSLFVDEGIPPLEQLPHEFRFQYRCDDDECRTHTQSLIDWELGQFYRQTSGRSEDVRLEMVKERWLNTVCGPERDVVFFSGNLARRQHIFLLLGTFWPPRTTVDQLSLAI